MHLRSLGIFLVLLAIPSLSLKDSSKNLQLQADSNSLNIFISASFLQETETETATVVTDDAADKAIIDVTIAATDDTDSEKYGDEDEEADDEIVTSISTIGDVAPPGMSTFLQEDDTATVDTDESAEKTEEDTTVLDSVVVEVEGYNEDPDGEEQYVSNSF